MNNRNKKFLNSEAKLICQSRKSEEEILLRLEIVHGMGMIAQMNIEIERAEARLTAHNR
jgi:hypothetical protein